MVIIDNGKCTNCGICTGLYGGYCLMDSIKIAADKSGRARKLLGIPKGYSVLGVLSLGYPDERIINIPKGYAVKTGWNKRGGTL